jgi:hypothetical protein
MWRIETMNQFDLCVATEQESIMMLVDEQPERNKIMEQMALSCMTSRMAILDIIR